MDARFYNSEDIDIERLSNDLVNIYIAQGFQAQQFGSKDQMLVQLKKGGDLEAIVGMQAALSLTLQRTAGGTLAMIGQQKWLDKAAIGTIGIVAFPVLWPLALTAGAGALRQASLANQVLNVVDGLVRQQRPNVSVGPIPVQLMPQVQQQWGPGPYPTTPAYIPPSGVPQALPGPAPVFQKQRCPNCNTPYEPGDTFCSGCGRSLTPPKVYCPNCHTELKAGVSFCPKCGASTFQAFTQSAQAPSAPAPQTPSYTPPAQPVQPAQPAQAPQTPYYVPSAQPSQPAQAPQTPSYMPPAVPANEPTVAAPPAQPVQPKPAPSYTPPVTQEPPVQPQPKVTFVPAPKPESAAPKQQPPQKQYYIPSSQAAAQPSAQAAAEQTVQAPVVPPKPLQAHPVSQPATDPNAPWGTLVFAEGKQVQLMGERAVVGRYDHDLGGIKPDVDLGDMAGFDTVSRIHAALEHIGSTHMLTDLNSTNGTRLNNKRLEPDKATPVNDGDTLTFGKVTCTFKKL
jgi:hypothetical protein